MELEARRQLGHAAPLVLAFLIPYLSYSLALILSLLGLGFVFYAGRRFLRGFFRGEELGRGYSGGQVTYALAIIVLVVLFFRSWPEVLAGAWAVMALGDAASAYCGVRLGGPSLPWNRRKHWAGSLAFFIFGVLGAAFMVWWVGGLGSGGALWPSALSAGGAGSAAESLSLRVGPWKVDDNLTTSLAAAAVLWVWMGWGS